jgi:hypothetical protein
LTATSPTVGPTSPATYTPTNGPLASPTYTSPGPFGGSSLAISFTNPTVSDNNGWQANEFLYSQNSTSGTYIYSSSTSTQSNYWGIDFWFNASSIPSAAQTQIGLVSLGGYGGWEGAITPMFRVGLSCDPATGLGEFTVASDHTVSGPNYNTSNEISPGTWYHAVLVDENGTTNLWLGTISSGQVTDVSIGTLADPAMESLGKYPDNIYVGTNMGGSGSGGEPGFNGAIYDLRLFTVTTTGTFNVTDTDGSPTPVIALHPGDANEDGRVDINDLTIVLANYGWSGTDGPMKTVPEPASLVLLGAGALALLAFIKRRRAS